MKKVSPNYATVKATAVIQTPRLRKSNAVSFHAYRQTGSWFFDRYFRRYVRDTHVKCNSIEWWTSNTSPMAHVTRVIAKYLYVYNTTL